MKRKANRRERRAHKAQKKATRRDTGSWYQPGGNNDIGPKRGAWARSRLLIALDAISLSLSPALCAHSQWDGGPS